MTIPCPYKRWDGSLKNMMLAFLPSVGAVIGLIWMGIFWCLLRTGISPLLISFVMMFYIFAVCGFMHMDGFMDCNDAIMSRRPLEERQRILKAVSYTHLEQILHNIYHFGYNVLGISQEYQR